MKKYYLHHSFCSSSIKRYEKIKDRFIPGDALEEDQLYLKTKLEGAEQIVFDFKFSPLGDALLALYGAKAFIDFLKAKNSYNKIEKIYQGNNYDLITHIPWLKDFKKQLSHQTSDRCFVVSNYNTDADYLFKPESTVAYQIKGDPFIFSALPHRYYLNISHLLQMKLIDPRTTFTQFKVASGELDLNKKEITCIGIIVSSSLSGRKSYPYFEEFIELLADLYQMPLHIYFFSGGENSDVRISKIKESKSYSVFNVMDGSLLQISALFSQMNLVIGNDTGLTHLAAMTQPLAPRKVLSLYNRHSYFKWNTGLKEHFCIATPFSHILGMNDHCPALYNIDERKWPNLSGFDNISPVVLASFCNNILPVQNELKSDLAVS